MKWVRLPADNKILGAVRLAVVCTLTIWPLSLVTASDTSAPIHPTVVVPSRCNITTTTRVVPRRDSRVSSVVGAAVTTCTRSSGALTLQLSGGARNCEDIGIQQVRTTVCGGLPAAAVARSLPYQRASETTAYVSLFIRGTPTSTTEMAIITIDF
jgi:hypothetical protein